MDDRPSPDCRGQRAGGTLFFLWDDDEHHQEMENEGADAGEQEQHNRVHLLELRMVRQTASGIVPAPGDGVVTKALISDPGWRAHLGQTTVDERFGLVHDATDEFRATRYVVNQAGEHAGRPDPRVGVASRERSFPTLASH